MIFQERCLKMVNNPLVFYFEKLKDDYDLKTYEDIAKYLERCVMILNIVCYHFCMMATQNIQYEMSICSMI